MDGGKRERNKEFVHSVCLKKNDVEWLQKAENGKR